MGRVKIKPTSSASRAGARAGARAPARQVEDVGSIPTQLMYPTKFFLSMMLLVHKIKGLQRFRHLKYYQRRQIFSHKIFTLRVRKNVGFEMREFSSLASIAIDNFIKSKCCKSVWKLRTSAFDFLTLYICPYNTSFEPLLVLLTLIFSSPSSFQKILPLITHPQYKTEKSNLSLS